MGPYSTSRALWILAGLTLLAASPLGAGEQLTIRVSPKVALAPATLVVNAVAERNAANRALLIRLESSDYCRSSVIQLDGDQAEITSTVRYEGVPGGTYDVSVTLFGSGGRRRAATSQSIEIISNIG